MVAGHMMTDQLTIKPKHKVELSLLTLCGVPKGSAYDSVVFSRYIYICTWETSHSIHCYANDILLH